MNKTYIKQICDTSMKNKFKQCDEILRNFKRSTRDHVLHILLNFDKLVTYDPLLDAYTVKGKYLVYYSKKLITKYSCQCHWYNYYFKLCSHVAVIRIYHILTFTDNLIERYLIYQAKKEIYRNQLRIRKRSPKYFSQFRM